MLEVTGALRKAHPGAAMGVLVMRGAGNPADHPEVAERIGRLEGELRGRFAGRNALRALPAMAAYEAYYKRFRKTYHVLLQLESVALKGRPIPRAGALVEAMVMAELKSLLLTAGHDLEAIRGPLRLDVATGGERYVMLNGQEQQLKPGDMMVADGDGVISCVVYGPDRRTRITPETRDVLYAVYAPPGIAEDAVHQHLHDLQANVRLAAPAAQVETLKVYGTR